MSETIDWKRPYGKVAGIETHGASYEQAGKLFTHDGRRIYRPNEHTEKPSAPERMEAAPAPEPQPVAQPEPATAQTIGAPPDPAQPQTNYADLKMHDLRVRYHKLTGKKIRAGTTRQDAIRMVREADTSNQGSI